MNFLKWLLDKSTRAVTFYYIEGTRLMNFLLKRKWFNMLMLNRFTLTAVLLLFIEGFQYVWDFGSTPRKNFYFIGFFVWLFITHVSFLYRITRTSIFGSVISLIFLILYLGYSVVVEVNESIEESRMEEVWAMQDSIQYEFEYESRLKEVTKLLSENTNLNSKQINSISQDVMTVFEKEYESLFPFDEWEDSFWEWLKPVLIILTLFILAIIGHSKWVE